MCALKLKHSHPFIDGLKDLPEGRKKDVQKIKFWMCTQPHLPEVSDDFIYLFLHACYYSQEKTKSAIECWFTIRASHPTIFSNRDPLEPKMKNLLDMGYVSFFVIHPEELKQKLKEQDAHMLCQFFDSEEYKRRVTSFLETQSRILSKETIAGTKKVQYQHVLSCAQPAPKKKFVLEPETKQTIKVNEPKSAKKAKKGTIFEQIVKRKNQKIEAAQQSDVKIVRRDSAPKTVVRHRTTIMPVFLKKMKKKQPKDYEEEECLKLHTQTARRISAPEDELEPLYAQILHRSNIYQKDVKSVNKQPAQKPQNVDAKAQPAEAKEERKYLKMENLLYKVKRPVVKTEQVSKKPVEDGDVKNDPLSLHLDPPKSDNVASTKPEHHASYKPSKVTSKLDDVALKLGGQCHIGQVPLRMSSSTARMSNKRITTQLCPKKSINMNLKSFSDLLCVERVYSKASKSKKKKTKNETASSESVIRSGKEAKTVRKPAQLQALLEDVRKSRFLDVGDNLERRNTMVAVAKRKSVQKKRRRQLELMSLFEKVKIGSSKNKSQTPAETNTDRRVVFQPKLVKHPSKETKNGDSCTYKIVARSRERSEAKLREKFALNPPFWRNTFSFKFGTPSSKKEKPKMDGKSERLSRNVAINSQRTNRFSGKKSRSSSRYLLRLPKTTPEGYRVLMYAVRDPDPTKMNFNDVVKGFCMYNDCVLSEDGLQDGYIVIFDMKDVGIGHLARVSLPALKCFMYYIQDAHPCRLKEIHVLNTASWIHHVMRLVVPLVRSELLNLVRFHKGNQPDTFPVELLPMDYGGEAPTVDELDRTTKSLLNKYRDWLVESAKLKADESKRTKKASWWGLFSSKSPQQNELDEKTILRNLQID